MKSILTKSCVARRPRIVALLASVAAVLAAPAGAQSQPYQITDASKVSGAVRVCGSGQNAVPNIRSGERVTIRVWGDWIENTESVRVEQANSARATLVRGSARNGFSHNESSSYRRGKGFVDVEVTVRDGQAERGRLRLTDRDGRSTDTLNLLLLPQASVSGVSVQPPSELGATFSEFDIILTGRNLRGVAEARDLSGAVRLVSRPTPSQPAIRGSGEEQTSGQIVLEKEVIELTDTRAVIRARVRGGAAYNRIPFSLQIDRRVCNGTGFVVRSRDFTRSNLVVAGRSLGQRSFVRSIRRVAPSRIPRPGDDVTVRIELTRPLERNLASIAGQVRRPIDPNSLRPVGRRPANQVQDNQVLWQISGDEFSAVPGTPYTPNGTVNFMNVRDVDYGRSSTEVTFRYERCPKGASPGSNISKRFTTRMHDPYANTAPEFSATDLTFHCPDN